MSRRIDPAEPTQPHTGGPSPRTLLQSDGAAATTVSDGSAALRVLMVHSFYQQLGGEDVVFNAEADLLERRGHHVRRFTRKNSDINQRSAVGKVVDAIWNQRIAHDIGRVVRDNNIDVVHFHNEFPVISPAAFRAARKAGAAVVKTLHNARPLCPKAVCFRNGQPCDVCVTKKLAWRGIWEGCYRDSRVATAVTSFSSWVHRQAKTFPRHVDICIAPTKHVQRLYADSGYPMSKIVIKPHFIEQDLGVGSGQGGYAMFAGRLSEEKGIQVLLEAWQQLHKTPELNGAPDLIVVGDGPMMDAVRSAGTPVQSVGHLPVQEVYERLGDAACLILPSSCAETFGRVAVEAFSRGTPVICADLGGQAEIVCGEAGLRFRPGDSTDLAAKVAQLFSNPDDLQNRRRAARQAYEDSYHAGLNYEQLIDVYRQALALRGRVFPTLADVDKDSNHHQLGRRTSGRLETVRASS